MKKPYIKKFETISKITVWIVDGEYIREYLDEEFTNFGQHYRFRFIPRNEFWIDKDYGKEHEEKYFIDHLLVEHRLMEKGMKYDAALGYGDRTEREERAKLEHIEKNKRLLKCKEEIIKRIHKKLLTNYDGGVKIWLVHGKMVRDLFFIDFTEGGHDYVYKFVPKNEVWLDEQLSPKERKFVLLHELHERNLMAKGWHYFKAHRSSSKIEYHCRHHPKELDKCIRVEVKKGQEL